MKRAESPRRSRGYRGKRRSGLTAEQVLLLAVVVLVAVMALTIRAAGKWTGMSAGEQLYQALFVAKDWE